MPVADEEQQLASRPATASKSLSAPRPEPPASATNSNDELDGRAPIPSLEQAPLLDLPHLVRDEASKALIEELDGSIVHDVLHATSMAVMTATASPAEEVGRVSVEVSESVHEDGQPCYLVTMAQSILLPRSNGQGGSGGTEGNNLKGFTLVAFVSPSLTTLRQTYEERELDGRKAVMDMWRDPLDGRVAVQQTDSDGAVTASFSIPAELADNLLTAGAEVVLIRVLSLHGITSGLRAPEAFGFPILDLASSVSPLQELSAKGPGVLPVSSALYTTDPMSLHVLHGRAVPLFGVHKTWDSADTPPRQRFKQWYTDENQQVVFCIDDRLADVVFEVVRRSGAGPAGGCGGDGCGASEDGDVDYSKDFALSTRFYEHKDASRTDCEVYVKQHPEIKSTVDDLMRVLLLKKPDDVYMFTREHFGSY
ncbi:hypothetical protein RI367_006263 [Sorochytrium milnesiophthora]